jgi:SAM-dependent methyltransferase/GNAT superfamily N-acetyltransferase
MNQDLGAVLLRSATPADAATIVAITQAAYRANDEKTGGMYAYVFDETAEQLAADMAEQPWRILIAEQAGQPVACVRISQNEPGRINLWRLAVLPEAQGAGLGRLVIDAIERWAVAWGRPAVTLAALEVSPENRALYERLGYTAYGRKEMGSMPGNYYTLLTKPVQRQPDRTVAIYEQIAEDYQARHVDGPWQQESLRHFSAALPAPARLLEVGCGPGRDARMLREAGYNVLALDRTWAMLRLAESSGASRIQADSRALPLRDGSVDGVWANASLLHLPRTELVIALVEIRRLLRPGGVFYSSFKRGHGQRTGRDGRWFAFYQPDEMARMLAGAGLGVADQWEADDQRAGHETWIMSLARAEGSADLSDVATDECGNPVGSVELNA